MMPAATVDLSVFDLGERPDLKVEIDALVAANLPPFLLWASPGNWRWHRLYSLFPDYQLALVDERGAVVAALNSVPLAWNGQAEDLLGGYDDVLVTATGGLADGPNATCLLSISVRRDLRRAGLAERLLDLVKARTATRDQVAVLGPLRPTRKSDHPTVEMAEYLTWTSNDGEIFDPWLRLHVGLGARVLAIAPRSLVIRQPARRWAELAPPGATAGPWIVPGGLVPVVIDPDGVGEYAEPNVWICHDLEPNPQSKTQEPAV